MPSTLNAIQALQSGDPAGFKSEIEALLTDKLNDAIELRKIDVAAELFGESAETDVEEDDDVKEVELQDEEEEDEEQQVDELSRKKLSQYVHAASDDAVNKDHDLGDKRAKNAEVDRFTNRHSTGFKERDDIKKMVGASSSEINRAHSKLGSRLWGIRRAAKKLEK